MSDPFIGRDIEGRFRIVEKIGEGGMGTVYRGRQHALGDCAIKVIHPDLIGNDVAVKRFMREAKIMADLAHPHVVAVRDFVATPDGFRFLIMELVRGQDLGQLVAEQGKLAPARIIEIGKQICDALGAAHARDIIHRDLKPSNVMLLANSRDLVKVLDFGLAKYLTHREYSQTTNPRMIVGTPVYMPPELIEQQKMTTRGDLYSLGCVLYELATGRLPFPGMTASEQLASRMTARPSPMPDVPRGLALVIECLLQRSPAQRYQSALDTRLALEAASRESSPGFDRTLLGVGGSAALDVTTEPGLPPGIKSSAPDMWQPGGELGLLLTPRPVENVEPTTPDPFPVHFDSSVSISGITEDGGSIEPTNVIRPRKKPVAKPQLHSQPLERFAPRQAQPLPPMPPRPDVPLPRPPPPLAPPRFTLVIPALLAIAIVLAILLLR